MRVLRRDLAGIQNLLNYVKKRESLKKQRLLLSAEIFDKKLATSVRRVVVPTSLHLTTLLVYRLLGAENGPAHAMLIQELHSTSDSRSS